MTEDAPQRDHSLREVFAGWRWIARTGVPWRMMPNDWPPWSTVYQQSQRWRKAKVFAAFVHGLRMRLRDIEGHAPALRAVTITARTMPSTPESGARAGYNGHQRRTGSKVPLAVDTLGQLLAVVVTPANSQERAQVTTWAEPVQAVTGETVAVAFVDHGSTGVQPAADAQVHGMRLEVVNLSETKRGFVLLPRRWVVARGFLDGTRSSAGTR